MLCVLGFYDCVFHDKPRNLALKAKDMGVFGRFLCFLQTMYAETKNRVMWEGDFATCCETG